MIFVELLAFGFGKEPDGLDQFEGLLGHRNPVFLQEVRTQVVLDRLSIAVIKYDSGLWVPSR